MYCLSNFCCVCLSITTDLLNLNKLDDDCIPILNKLIFIAFGHERLDLDITKSICSTCLKDLRIAYKFKTTCLTSSVSISTDLEVTLSEQERALTDQNSRKTVKSVPGKKYKPRPLCKQKEHLAKKEETKCLKKPERVLFKCKHCNDTFTTKMRRKIHFNKTHHKNLRKFKSVIKSETPTCACSMCEKSFNTAKQLKYHIRSVHFNDSKCFCRHCNRSFANRKAGIMHMKAWHNYNNFSCQICNRKYIKEVNYNKHMALHAENKIVKLKKVNKKQKAAKRRKMITRYLVCNTCDEIFINSAELHRHMVTHGKSSFSIDNTFENGPNESDNSEILRQILTQPPLDENTNSEISDIEILPEIKLEPIIEIKEENLDEDPLQPSFNFNVDTPNLNANNDQSPLLISGSTVEHTNQNSNNNQGLRNDESSNSSEVEVSLYECNICNKQFTVKSFLNAHLLIHNNAAGPNFECIQCSHTFTDKKDFAQHILKNTCGSFHPTNKFSCGICYRLFKHEFSLKQHLRTH